MKRIGKIVVTILIAILGCTLCACTPDFSNVSIAASYEQNQDGKLELVLGEQKQITFVLENLVSGFDTGLDLSLTANKVSLEQKTLDNGSTLVKVTATSYGDCVLRATTKQGGKYIDINITVTLAIADFDLKQDVKLFAVRGTSNPQILYLDDTIFNFTPQNTTQNQIQFYSDQSCTNQIYQINPDDSQYDGIKQITIYAKSQYLEKVLPISVDIVDEIKSVQIYNLEEQASGTILGDEILYEQGQNQIILISNKSAYSRKSIRLVVDCGAPNLLKNTNRYTQQNVVLATTLDTVTTGEQDLKPYFDISLQALNEGSTDIQFILYYQGYSNYEVSIPFVFKVVSAPEQILVNDLSQQNLGTQILFNNVYSTVVSNLNVMVAPTTAIVDKIVLSSDTANFSDYIKLSYGGAELSLGQELTSFDLPLVAKGLQTTSQTIYLTLTLYWGQNQGINHDYGTLEYNIGFEVKTGASAPVLDDQSFSTGIYLDLDDGEKTFDHFYVKEQNAYTTGLSIYCLSDISVAQITENTLADDPRADGKTISLNINPVATGSARYKIVLPNGVYSILTVNVIKQFEQIAIDIDEQYSPNVIAKDYQESMLKHITMQLQKDVTSREEKYTGVAKLSILADGKTATIDDKKLFDLKITSQPVDGVIFDNDTLTVSKNVSDQTILSWTLSYSKVENFKLVGGTDEDAAGEIKLKAFTPLEASFDQSEISLYSYSDLGINYKNESKAIVTLSLTPKDNIDDNDLKTDWYASNAAGVMDGYYDQTTKILTITGYGTYNTNTGEFTLDVTRANTTSFDVFVKLDYNGQITICSFRVNPLQYINVKSIKLNNYIGEYVYLSPTNAYVDIFTYVLPQNAIHQELAFRFEPNSGSSASIVGLQNLTDGTKNIGVRVCYNNNGGGSGQLVIIAQATIENNSQTPQSALKIDIKVADGSYQNPYRISTAQDFASIASVGLDKHYYVEGTIDLSNTNIALGNFTGTMRGQKNAKIVGINITQINDGYAGLFAQISPKTEFAATDLDEFGTGHSGEISLISFTGALNLQINQSDLEQNTADIGLVCGYLANGAILSNINVTLQGGKIDVATDKSINIGTVAGTNKGSIITHINQNSYRNLVYMQSALLIEYSSENKSEGVYVGGVVGFNDGDGKILRISYDEQPVLLIGNDNYLAIVNIDLQRKASQAMSAFNVGAIAGKNQATISAGRNIDDNYHFDTTLDTTTYSDYIKTSGSISLRVQDYSIIGGLVAVNQGSDAIFAYCVSRTKIKSLGDGQGGDAFLGGLYGKNQNGAKINNCHLQAIEDGSSTGVNASMIYSKSFGLDVQNKSIISTQISVYGFGSTFGGTLADGVTNLSATTYVGEDTANNISGRQMVGTGVSMNVNNYYGDMFVGSTQNGEAFWQTKFVARQQDVAVSANKNPMMSETGTDLVSYAYYYQANDTSEQSYLASLNTIVLPFDVDGEVLLSSFDQDVVRIQNDGSLYIVGTGLCKLRITSALNQKNYLDVYLYVVSSFDDYVLVLNSSLAQNQQIYSGQIVSIISGDSVVLNLLWQKENYSVSGYDIVLVAQKDANLTNVQTLNGSFDFYKSGDTYILSALQDTGIYNSQEFTLKLYYQKIVNGHLYTTLYQDKDDPNKTLGYLKNSNGNEYQTIFTAKNIKGVTKIKLDSQYIAIQPEDNYAFALDIQTDNFASIPQGQYLPIIKKYQNYEYFDTNLLILEQKSLKIQISASTLLDKIDIQKLSIFYDNNSDVYVLPMIYDTDNNFVTVYLDTKTKTLSLDGTNFVSILSIQFDYCSNYNFAIMCNSQNIIQEVLSISNIIVSYNLSFDTQNIADDYDGEYFITWTMYNTAYKSVSNALQVCLQKQQPTKVLLESFTGASAQDINNGSEQTIYHNPGTPNHFRITVVPVYSDFDYMTLVCETDDFLISLIDSSGNVLTAGTLVDNGIKISKDYVSQNNGIIYIKYLSGTMDVQNGAVYNFAVTLHKDDEIIYKTNKQITIKYAKDVTLTINTDQKIDDTIYLTRGSTYDYTLQNFGYTEDEITYQTNRSDLITFDTANKKIIITSKDINYPDNQQGGIVATITAFGTKIVDGEQVISVKDVQNIRIVEYFIKPTGMIVKDGSDGMINVALGDSFVLDTQLVLDTNVEYSSSLLLNDTLEIFTNQVTQNAVWQYQLANLGENGKYYFTDSSSNWNNIVTNVSALATDNNFTATVTDGAITITPLKINERDNQRYRFRLLYGFEYDRGLAVYKDFDDEVAESYFNRAEIFGANVYQLSSIQTPTPISTYSDLLEMQEGVYYIQLEDITLPSDFEPINTNIAGFDGNGKNIIMTANMSATGLSRFGLFGKIEKDTLIRNINIQIKNSLRLVLEDASSMYVGILAGENNGIITNCSVQALDDNNIRVVFDKQDSSNYFAGLVGLNNGYITSSRVSINCTTYSNLAGFVGVNAGKIAACAVQESLLVNTATDIDCKSAGFVCENQGDGKDSGLITTSYVSGKYDKKYETIYANDKSKQLRSSTESAGFVYQNKSKIVDCYSDIPVTTSSKSAGFVFANFGSVQTSFSTSILKSNSQESYGFVCDNSEGTLQDTYYLSESGIINYSINTTNTNITGLKPLSMSSFNGNDDSFANYAFAQNSLVTMGNWFFPTDLNIPMFNNDKYFVKNRPELVSANIIVSSKQTLDVEQTFTDPDTGEVTYYYKNIGESQGSIHNPYVIISAEMFEETLAKTSSNSLNSKYYRIVCDLDYTDLVNSNAFGLIFIGDIEGNNMSIQNFVIDNADAMTSAGFFSKIGNGGSQQGCVKNLTVKPKYINLPNASCVGTLAGTLDGGNLFNINIENMTSQSTLVVMGKNIVGGVVGRAINKFNLKNCSSQLSVNSTYRSSTVLGENNKNSVDRISSYFVTKSHTSVSLAKCSYSGCIAGVLAGTGYVNNISISGNVTSIAEFAGLLVGGIGNGVTLSDVDQHITGGQSVQAAVYGGILAAESYGRIQNVDIYSSSEIANLFRSVPFTPYAVGGIVGLLGATENIPTNSREVGVECGIYNSYIKTDIRSGYIRTIGGIAGEMIGSNISNSGFDGNIYGSRQVGGLVGKFASEPAAAIRSANRELVATTKTSEIANCYVKGGELSIINDDIGTGIVGGLIASASVDFGGKYQYSEASNKYALNIHDCYNQNSINIKSDIYGNNYEIYAGGLIAKLNAKTQSVVFVSNVYVDSTITLDLRDLKENNNPTENYCIYYGNFIGYKDDEITVLNNAIKDIATYKSYFCEQRTHQLQLSRFEDSAMKIDNDFIKNQDIQIQTIYNELICENPNNCTRLVLASQDGWSLTNSKLHLDSER